MTSPFRWPVRVYYEDTDAAGIVYHARYLHFAERARTEMLRTLGFDHASLKTEQDTVFAVQRCDLHFMRAARLDDALFVATEVTHQTGARLEFEQCVWRGDELLCRIGVTLAVLSGDLRPKRLPSQIVAAFATQQRE